MFKVNPENLEIMIMKNVYVRKSNPNIDFSLRKLTKLQLTGCCSSDFNFMNEMCPVSLESMQISQTLEYICGRGGYIPVVPSILQQIEFKKFTQLRELVWDVKVLEYDGGFGEDDYMTFYNPEIVFVDIPPNLRTLTYGHPGARMLNSCGFNDTLYGIKTSDLTKLRQSKIETITITGEIIYSNIDGTVDCNFDKVYHYQYDEE
jgi:hypothetical protein